jgi:hypothetical protein
MSRTKGKPGRTTPKGGGANGRPPRPSCAEHGKHKWCDTHQRWEHP